MVTTISNKMLDRLARTREFLNLVEDDKGVSFNQPRMRDAFEIQKERIKVVKILVEDTL